MTGLAKTVTTVTPTGTSTIDGLLTGSAWSGTITYAFPTLASSYSYTTQSSQSFAAATTAQKNAMLSAIEQTYGNSANDGFSVEGFTNAAFSANTPGTATLRLAQSSQPTTATAYGPGTTASAGDMWLGTTVDYTSPQAGNNAYHTELQLVGYGLGLKTAHVALGSFAAMPTAFDSVEYTVMSARSYQGASTSGGYTYASGSAPQTFMMADIAALQSMYGADYSTNSRNTSYSWKPTTGDTYVNGEVGIDASGSVIFATIWDGGGIDTYNLKAYTTAVSIDLSPGGHSSFGASQLANLGNSHSASGSIYNAMLYNNDVRSLIENAVGGSGNDTITGNVANNVLTGNDGNDTMSGLDGNDNLIGGKGNDTLLLGEGNNYADGGAGDDTITGGSGNDTIIGGTGDDVIQAGNGANIITDTSGADQITGGTGIDKISSGIGNDILSGLGGNDILNGQAGNDTVQGGNGNDTLKGEDGADRLVGGVGDDLLFGGKNGDTFVFGVENGDDKIFDFLNGVDHIELDGFGFDSAADVIDLATKSGRNVVLTLSAHETITIANCTLGNLDASDFLLVA